MKPAVHVYSGEGYSVAVPAYTLLPRRWWQRPTFRSEGPLTVEFTAISGDRVFSECYSVPEGTETDFATIPRSLWWLFPPDGPWAPAAALHDELYRRGWFRPAADAVFWRTMLAVEVPGVIAYMLYKAVRLCGWLYRRVEE